MKKRMMLLLMLVSCLTVSAFAHEVPDLSRKGSVEISADVAGGTLTLYRVGEVSEEDGNYSFIPTGDFADCGLVLEDVSSADLAAALEQYAMENDLKGTTKEIRGSVLFEELESGLYLVAQETAAPGYSRMNPFLVSIPMLENGVYLYDVDASPKMGEVSKTEPPTTQPTKPADPTLPQTGQLNWPVAALTVLGLGLSAAGWSMRKREK